MKVRDLIASLAYQDPEAEVHVAYDYGDHSHTLVAPKVRYAETVGIRYSDYFSMPIVIEDMEEHDDPTPEKNPVVLFVNSRVTDEGDWR